MGRAPHPDVLEPLASRFPRFDLSILTSKQREVVAMHYDSNLSFGAIAVLLGVSKATAQTHHRRALEKLLDAMSYGQDLK